MPTISSVSTEQAPPLQIQTGSEDIFKVFATIQDTVSVSTVTINSNDPVLLTLVIDPENPIINNVGDFQFHLKAVANDFSLGSNQILLTITAININGDTVTHDVNYEIIVSHNSPNTGLSVPGTLTVTQTSLQAIGSSLDKDIKYAVAAVDRTKVDGSVSFTHFIKASYDLNSLVTYYTTSNDHDLDDAYSFAGLTVNSNSASDIELSLPSASAVAIKAGEIDAQDPNNNSLGKFPVTLLISCNDQGDVTSSIGIGGADITPGAELLDDAHKSQIVYWPPVQNNPGVNADDADILNTKITSGQLSSYYASQLTNINNLYNGNNVISSWSITINPITASSSNILAQHARFLGVIGNNNIFNLDDKIVCATPFSYSVSVNDYLDDTTIIVPSTNVFGVIAHKS